tara:strand:- start:1839 stop:2207 length:369 start_codon:yes stop_codon:yes gene_type:complete
MNSSSNPQPNYASMVYDFNIDGWSEGFFTPYENSIIPNNAIINNVYMEVLESLEGASDGLFLCEIGGNNLTIATYSSIPAGTIYTTFAHNKSVIDTPMRPLFTVELTQGKFNIIVEYFMSGE